ncbi:MAG: nucleotide sugar dehydrogenase [Acidobacteriota bacterium]
MELHSKIEDRSARIAVVGLGYVGLPLSLEFLQAGFPVAGIDIDQDKLKALRSGKSHIGDVSARRLEDAVAGRRFHLYPNLAAADDPDVVIICVPTPLRKTRDPDISYIVAALDQIAGQIRKGMLVVLESTTYPGTTEEVLLPRLQAGGLVVGRDFHLAFSPERVDPGNEQFGTHNTPKVVGGVTPACTEIAAALYRTAVEVVIPVGSTRSAEMVKLLENTFRAVNIGLVNEMTLMCDRLGIDVWEVIDAAASKPFGFMPFYPGPGIGGHCIPLDPHYLAWKLKTLNYSARFIELASEVNSSMPLYVAGKVAELLNDREKSVRGSRILVLGVTYKRGTGDVRESPALDLIRLLQEKGAELLYSDPYVPALKLDGMSLTSLKLGREELKNLDCAVLVTDHEGVDYQLVLDCVPAVFDARNATRGLAPGDCLLRRL